MDQEDPTTIFDPLNVPTTTAAATTIEMKVTATIPLGNVLTKIVVQIVPEIPIHTTATTIETAIKNITTPIDEVGVPLQLP